MTPEERIARNKKIAKEWSTAGTAVDASEAEMYSPNERGIWSPKTMADDKAYYSAYKTFIELAHKVGISIGERERVSESGSIDTLNRGINYCNYIFRKMQEMAKEEAEELAAAGFPQKTCAQIANTN